MHEQAAVSLLPVYLSICLTVTAELHLMRCSPTEQ